MTRNEQTAAATDTQYDIIDAAYPQPCEINSCGIITDIGFEASDDEGIVAVFACEAHAEEVMAQL